MWDMFQKKIYCRDAKLTISRFMRAPIRSLRTIFALSVLASAFWGVGFALEPLLGRDAPIPLLIFVATCVMLVVCLFTFRNGRLLVLPNMRLRKLIAMMIPRLAVSCLALVPSCAIVVWGLVQLLSSEPLHPEVNLFTWLFSLWFPLWLSPAVASALTWHKCSAKTECLFNHST